MNTLSLRSSFKAGWKAFMRRPWYLLGLTLALVVMCILTAGNGAFSALTYIVYGGFLALCIQHLRGQHVVFDDLFTLDQRWIYFTFLGVIKFVLIALGFLCFIIPGIYLSVRWIFAELLVLDHGLRPLEALRKSSELTAGVRWKLFFFVVLSVLLILGGVLALLVGALVASLVATFALIHLYETRQSLLATATVPPPTPAAHQPD